MPNTDRATHAVRDRADEDGSVVSFFVPTVIQGKDEMNLAEFPIARLGRNDTRLSIEYQGQIVDKAGNVLEQKWLVSGSATFGLPTEFADRVLVALMAITAGENFSSRRVIFTIYRVLKMLGLSHNKRNYDAVEKALHQLVGVTIYSEGAFWDKGQQKRVTTKKGFHLVEELWLRSFDGDEESSESEGVNGYVVWSERIWNSFHAGYIKNLDIDFYYSLQNTLARRLYRFLDKRMHYQNAYQIDIFDLSARLGMKAYRYPSHLARKLQPGFDELIERGYLKSAEVVKVGKFRRVKFVRTAAAPSYQATLWDSAPVVADAHGETPSELVRTASAHTAPVGDKLAALYARYNTSQALKDGWHSILRQIEQALPYSTYAMMADSLLLDVDSEEAIVAVNETYRDWIERQMQRQFVTMLNTDLELSTKVKQIAFVALP